MNFRETILRDSQVKDFWSKTFFVEKANPRDETSVAAAKCPPE